MATEYLAPGVTRMPDPNNGSINPKTGEYTAKGVTRKPDPTSKGKVQGTQQDDQSKQPLKTYTYPVELDNIPNANVVMFSILETSDIGVSQQAVRGSGQNVSKNIKKSITNDKPINAPNIVDNIHDAAQAMPKTINEVLGKLGDSMNFNNYQSKVRTIICLPIPDMDIKSDYSLNYQTSNLGVAGNLVNNIANGGGLEQFIKNASSTASRALLGSAGVALQGVVGRDVGDVLGNIESSTRTTFNPKLELLFKSVDLRNFAFSYSFAPANSAEALLLHNIILELRKAAAPSLNPDGFYMNYPHEIHVEYRFQGKENVFLPRIGRSCITGIKTSWDRSLLSNGHPAVMSFRLEIMEIVQVMRKNISEGY